MPDFVKVANVADLAPGKVKQIAIGPDRYIALCNVGGTFYALDNVCIHRGGPLGEGYLDGEKLECPWHAWTFNVKTGCLTVNVREKVPTYEVKIEGSDVLVAL
jgi:3-phenylpropionate/trans-cinnamate dioxygenase ferredoxin component